MPDFSAVGNSASAPKDKTGLSGNEVFDNEVNIKKASNGGYVMSVSYRRDKSGNSRDQTISDYCPPKTEVFETLDSAASRMGDLFGESVDSGPDQGGSDAGAAPAGGAPDAADSGSSGSSGY